MLYKDGRVKEYFYYTSTSTYCRTQVLGYKQGTVKIDKEAKTFEVYYASGHYRSFNPADRLTLRDLGKQNNTRLLNFLPRRNQI